MPSQVNRYYNYVNNYQKADEPSAARSVVTDAVNSLSNIGGTVYGIISDLRNQKRADETSAWQMQQDLFNNAFAVNQFNEGMRQYNQNYEMEKKAMDMTQSNFENSAQIRTADMAKAGLNPLNYSGSDGATVSFSGGNNVSGSANSSSVGNNQVNALGAQLLMRLAEMKFEKEENEKNRKSAETIANIQANASKYHSDLGYIIGSDSNDIARIKVIQEREVQDAKLQEEKFQFDEGNYIKMKLTELELNSERALKVLDVTSENARHIQSELAQNYRSVMSNYQIALQTSAQFAIALNQARLAWKRFDYEQDRDKKNRDLENTKIALESAARQMESITGLAGDVCKAFILGQIKSGR